MKHLIKTSENDSLKKILLNPTFQNIFENKIIVIKYSDKEIPLRPGLSKNKGRPDIVFELPQNPIKHLFLVELKVNPERDEHVEQILDYCESIALFTNDPNNNEYNNYQGIYPILMTTKIISTVNKSCNRSSCPYYAGGFCNQVVHSIDYNIAEILAIDLRKNIFTRSFYQIRPIQAIFGGFGSWQYVNRILINEVIAYIDSYPKVEDLKDTIPTNTILSENYVKYFEEMLEIMKGKITTLNLVKNQIVSTPEVENAIINAIKSEWKGEIIEEQMAEWERVMADKLYQEKYSTKEWNLQSLDNKGLTGACFVPTDLKEN
ncbi:MAG: hypothetical protein HWN65_14330 [Candidatus Helarchaeota archaeon]|nr:hypothetical protein [Candidatus Helarchaeota archaeon]